MLPRATSATARFFAATAAWWVGLVALALGFQALTWPSGTGLWGWWTLVFSLATFGGVFLPCAAFAGGLAAGPSLTQGGVVARTLILVAVSYWLLAYGAPLAEYQARASAGADVVARYPAGLGTPAGLRAWREAVEANPPERYSLSVERPLERPPNYITYLLHGSAAVAAFALLAALLGYRTGRLTNGLPPPPRSNARWAIGLATTVAFYLALRIGDGWVQGDPTRSGILGAWLPLAVPLAVLILVGALARARPAGPGEGAGPEAP